MRRATAAVNFSARDKVSFVLSGVFLPIKKGTDDDEQFNIEHGSTYLGQILLTLVSWSPKDVERLWATSGREFMKQGE